MSYNQSTPLLRWSRSLANKAWLDPAASFMTARSSALFRSPKLEAVAHGAWLGHPFHPALTDLPIGFWTSAFMLDFLGGEGANHSARRLIGWGNLAAVPTAVAGLADARQLDDKNRRVAVVHGALNAGGLLAYVLSWTARRRPYRKFAIASSLVGATLLTVAGHLGGHMAFDAGDDQREADGASSAPVLSDHSSG